MLLPFLYTFTFAFFDRVRKKHLSKRRDRANKGETESNRRRNEQKKEGGFAAFLSHPYALRVRKRVCVNETGSKKKRQRERRGGTKNEVAERDGGGGGGGGG